MNFQRGRQKEEPEINLIPMIDVLLVILIFLVVTTTYSKFAALKINLPQSAVAETGKNIDDPDVVDVVIDATGNYTINHVSIQFSSVNELRDQLRTAVGDKTDPLIIISADAKATHQSVVTVMEAARLANYTKITFTTKASRAD